MRTVTNAHKFLNASGLVKQGPAVLDALVLTADADAASVTVYDGVDATGEKVLSLKAAIGATVALVGIAIYLTTGCYLVITGTTPDVTALIQ